MDAVELPVSVLISIGSGVLTIGAVYGIITSKIVSLQKELTELKNEQAKTAQALNIEEKERIKLEGEFKVLRANDAQHRADMDEVKLTMVRNDVFTTRTTEQDKILRRIDQRLDAGARTASAQMRAADLRPDPRRDDDSEPPNSGLPPMRPRLPSRRGPGE